MKSRFLVKTYIVALLIFAGIFFLVSCSQSEGENWKKYSQDSEATYYYDKGSIHYPQQKKTLLGITVQNKEIVNVWTREVSKKDGKIGDAMIEQISCIERQYAGHRSERTFSLYDNVKELPKTRAPIEPGSLYESLLKKVCP